MRSSSSTSTGSKQFVANRFPRSLKIIDTISLLTIIMTMLLLGGCSSVSNMTSMVTSSKPANLTSTPDAVPKHEPLCKYGNMDSYKVLGKTYRPMKSAAGFRERGVASWYGPNFDGKPTSCMERYDMYKMSAAHKTLPLPSYVEVTNLDNNRKVVVRVNDRGPFHEGRIIDLSYTAALKLGIIKRGTAPVSIRVVPPGEESSTNTQDDIYLQLGLFSERKNASALQQKLTERITTPVEIRSVASGDKRLHQVVIEPRNNHFSIDTIRNQLRKIGIEAVVKKR